MTAFSMILLLLHPAGCMTFTMLLKFFICLHAILQNFCQNIPNVGSKVRKFVVKFKVHIENHKPVF